MDTSQDLHGRTLYILSDMYPQSGFHPATEKLQQQHTESSNNTCAAAHIVSSLRSGNRRCAPRARTAASRPAVGAFATLACVSLFLAREPYAAALVPVPSFTRPTDGGLRGVVGVGAAQAAQGRYLSRRRRRVAPTCRAWEEQRSGSDAPEVDPFDVGRLGSQGQHAINW